MSTLPPKSGKGALPGQPYAAWARAVKATDVTPSSAGSIRKPAKTKAAARKVAAVWVMGLEEQNKSEESIRERKAKFRRKYVEELLRVTTVQGFLNFSFRDRHYSEHVLWAVAMVGACVGSLFLCLETWERYQENPVVMSLESSYINWKYFLPSTIVCPENKSNPDSTNHVAQRLMGGATANQELIESFLEALANSTSYSTAGFLNKFQNNSEELPKPQDWLELALQVRWNLTSDGPVPKMESIFEVGICYAANSQVAHYTAVNISLRNDTPPPPLVKSAYSAPETLRDFGFNSPFTLYVQGMESLPRPGVPTGLAGANMAVMMALEVTQVYATRALEELTVKQRRCRFADEVVPGSPRLVYSYDVCMESCRAQLAQRFCNCRPFFISVENIPICDIKGMACISEHSEVIIWLRNRTSEEQIDCNCYPACDLYMYRQLDREVTRTDLSMFPPRYDVQIQVYKRTRIKRDVLFSIIDLAVSFGGAVGLFLGVSVLSVLEVIYYFTLRLFFHPQRRNFLNI